MNRIRLSTGFRFGTIGPQVNRNFDRGRRILPTFDGTVTLFAGTGEPGVADGPAAEATFTRPDGITLGADGAVRIDQSTDIAGNHPTQVRRIEIVDLGS